MAISRAKKEEIVRELEENLKGAKVVILTNFSGLKVEDLDQLRKKAKDLDLKYKVVKNTLLKLVLKKLGLSLDEEIFGSPLALGFGQDTLVISKIFWEFSKDHPNFEIKGAFLNREFVPPSYIKGLALLPSREELYWRLISSLNNPLYRFRNLVLFNIRSLVYLLNSYKESKVS